VLDGRLSGFAILKEIQERFFSIEDARALVLPPPAIQGLGKDIEWRSRVLFGLYTDQRLADLATLRWDNIDLARKRNPDQDR
jgi:hypothetical protein